ncbi:unnamed protein product [Closterium sp. NIES-64]|nr:unnamed protein product [Closterium sp. NIES-64]
MTMDDRKRKKRSGDDSESDGEEEGKGRRGEEGRKERKERKEKERKGGRREKGERRRKRREKKRRSSSDDDASSSDWSGSSRNSSSSESESSSDSDSSSDHGKKRERRREKRGKEKEKRRRKEGGRGHEQDGESAEDRLERDLRRMMREFPLDVSHDLVRLLERVDGGEAVDVGGIPDRRLKKLLGSIFRSLGIDSQGKSKGKGGKSKRASLYQLPSAAPRCLPRVVPLVAKLLQNLPDPEAAAAGAENGGGGGKGEERGEGREGGSDLAEGGGRGGDEAAVRPPVKPLWSTPRFKPSLHTAPPPSTPPPLPPHRPPLPPHRPPSLHTAPPPSTPTNPRPPAPNSPQLFLPPFPPPLSSMGPAMPTAAQLHGPRHAHGSAAGGCSIAHARRGGDGVSWGGWREGVHGVGARGGGEGWGRGVGARGGGEGWGRGVGARGGGEGWGRGVGARGGGEGWGRGVGAGRGCSVAHPRCGGDGVSGGREMDAVRGGSGGERGERWGEGGAVGRGGSGGERGERWGEGGAVGRGRRGGGWGLGVGAPGGCSVAHARRGGDGVRGGGGLGRGNEGRGDGFREAEQALQESPFVGPMPPALAAEAANATQAEKYEEVERILDPELTAYAILGVTPAAGDSEIKKRYWKASLLVHPDKCSHPLAQEAFLRLNDAVNRLKDPSKRSVVDAEIAAREEHKEMEAELRALREAAEWRKLRGEALPGDDELLGTAKREGMERETWMTELPPERQARPPAQTNTFFSRSDKVGRGDTSAWTDNPEQRAARAKQQYLEAYSSAANALEGPSADSAAALQSLQDKRTAALVDNLAAQKQAVSLVEQHRKKQAEGGKKKSKGKEKGKGKGEGERGGGGNAGWRMWDREKDLEVKPKAMKWTADGMAQGLSGRFSGAQSGSRKFL